MKRLIAIGAFLFTTAWPLTQIAAEPAAWPQFRGPNGCGVAPGDQPVPTVFGPEQHCLWRTELPPGHSSPCIWDNRIFLTGFDAASNQVELICVDRASGAIRWRKPAPEVPLEKSLHRFNSPAASTPATDGQRVYLYLGAYGALAFGLDGNEV